METTSSKPDSSSLNLLLYCVKLLIVYILMIAESASQEAHSDLIQMFMVLTEKATESEALFFLELNSYNIDVYWNSHRKQLPRISTQQAGHCGY